MAAAVHSPARGLLRFGLSLRPCPALLASLWRKWSPTASCHTSSDHALQSPCPRARSRSRSPVPKCAPRRRGWLLLSERGSSHVLGSQVLPSYPARALLPLSPPLQVASSRPRVSGAPGHRQLCSRFLIARASRRACWCAHARGPAGLSELYRRR